MKVIKRDGRIVEFDRKKIIAAIMNAFEEVDSEMNSADAIKISNSIADSIENKNKELAVEEIQDLIESKLMASKRKDVAKAYVLYRNKRTLIRENKTQLMRDISEKLAASNVQNQNANIDEKSFGGRIGEASDAVLKKYALDNCMSDMAKRNHLSNQIYIHDLNSYAVGMHNCLSIPFDKLLKNGFNTRQTDVRPANSVNTAFQLVAVIFQLQSLQEFGGVSATHLDWTMVPYVRKSFAKHFLDGMYYCELETMDGNDLIDKGRDYISTLSIEDDSLKSFEKAYNYALDMTVKEVYQAVEGMYHNLSNWAA